MFRWYAVLGFPERVDGLRALLAVHEILVEREIWDLTQDGGQLKRQAP